MKLLHNLSKSPHIARVTQFSTALLIPFENAVAKDGEYGILEGRTAALIHPAIMLSLFAITVYSGVLGVQYRRLRNVGEELKEVSRSLPKLSSGTSASFPLTSTLLTLQSNLQSTSDPTLIASINSDIKLVNCALSIDEKYDQLNKEKKTLQNKNLKNDHFNAGSLLLAVGISNAIYGALNSYWGSGELYPDSHLFFGATIAGIVNILYWRTTTILYTHYKCVLSLHFIHTIITTMLYYISQVCGQQLQH